MIPWYLLLLLVLSLCTYADVTGTSACCFSKVLEGATMNVRPAVLQLKQDGRVAAKQLDHHDRYCVTCYEPY